MAFKRLTPMQLEEKIEGPEELALLDLREAGQLVLKRLFRAAPMPLWRLETLIGAGVPRRETPVVLADLDGSLVLSGAEKLSRLGYQDVSILEGGTLAWEKAGYEVFIDQNLPSKAFGEFIDQKLSPPSVTAPELARMIREGRDLVILDGRTKEEFLNFSLPGAYNVPNGELALRAPAYAPGKDTLIVVNCAGRTRSIIGCQTLINAGLPNQVRALQNGTLGWLLSGEKLEVGSSPAKIARTRLREPLAESLGPIRERLRRWLEKSGARLIGDDEFKSLQSRKGKTLYLFDPRAEEEYAGGHLPGFRLAPGGQLVQATDRYAPVLRASIVIADFDSVRALAAAAWLAQAGAHEVFVYPASSAKALAAGLESSLVLLDPAAPWPKAVSPEKAAELQARGAEIYDVDNSVSWFLSRVENSKFCAPPSLPQVLKARKDPLPAVLTSKDGILARTVAASLGREGLEAVSVLGGTGAWIKMGLKPQRGPGEILSGEDDIRRSACEYGQGLIREHSGANEKDFENYLAWEVNLPEQIGKPGAKASFRAVTP
ncbi:MAG: rhodanese [Deltaproteobacteria bacterium]|jgi:rhodanese-related sulfurtransferase|nr:rhodanese [Deltaproteobacteria bacterium]